MTRHPTDQPRTRGASKLAAFLRQERADRPHASTLALQSRPKPRADAARKASEYLRIARADAD
ncbi:hypothetical protein E4L95_17920 [Paracoccus liaowanqingii]|uniref:Uncharacterized protein n=1 Tax=Paracoccus liaowanqingii TaxID=2560053 RepID=A0A4Z1C9U3_9RHOB|nr:hypothetical protein [Paracoccus liaowanqingii]TGN49916.1 hypothetical protein E4L95_17920 [Paracoccus liaowanqingii]